MSATHQRIDLVEGLELRRRRMHRRHDDAPAPLRNSARPVSAWPGLALLSCQRSSWVTAALIAKKIKTRANDPMRTPCMRPVHKSGL